MTQRCHVNQIRILWMNSDARDLSRVFETDSLPRLASIVRLVNTIAVRDVAANRRLTHADVNRVWIRIRDCDGANGACSKHRAIADRVPVDAAVCRFPNAAAG